MTKIIFCDFEQTDTYHDGSVDQNNDLLFQCSTPECGHFIKLPSGMTVEEIDAWLSNYKETNVGKVTVAEVQAVATEQENVLSQLSEAPIDPQTT